MLLIITDLSFEFGGLFLPVIVELKQTSWNRILVETVREWNEGELKALECQSIKIIIPIKLI